MSAPRSFLEEPGSYLLDSINTRVPPMYISGKKSTSLSKLRWESPIYHSHSYQNFPKPNILIREASPRPEVFLPPLPIVKNIRPVVYRPAFPNLNNRITVPMPNLNPFEVVEQLFLEEENSRNYFIFI